jgi:hypothetical protein
MIIPAMESWLAGRPPEIGNEHHLCDLLSSPRRTTTSRRTAGRAHAPACSSRIRGSGAECRLAASSVTVYNMLGTDVTWNLKRIPLDLRAEAIQTTKLGGAYWVEAAYRLDRLGRKAFWRNSLLAVRGEQYRVPAISQTLLDELPDRNTSRATLGCGRTRSTTASASILRMAATSHKRIIRTSGRLG